MTTFYQCLSKSLDEVSANSISLVKFNIYEFIKYSIHDSATEMADLPKTKVRYANRSHVTLHT